MIVSAIYVFPIKSCAGYAVESARVTARGIEDDRRFMLVDAAGHFVSQREDASLSQFDVQKTEGGFEVRRRDHAGLLSLKPSHCSSKLVQAEVWSTPCEGWLHVEGSDFFSAHLRRSVRLIYQDEQHFRPLKPKYGAGEVSYADGFPLLLANLASLHDLNRRARREFEMLRFRPNVVVSGFGPWHEDSASSWKLGELSFAAPKPCERCVITTIDPATGIADREPLKTLATFRRTPDGVLFGVNLVPQNQGTIRVGDPVLSA